MRIMLSAHGRNLILTQLQMRLLQSEVDCVMITVLGSRSELLPFDEAAYVGPWVMRCEDDSKSIRIGSRCVFCTSTMHM